MIKANEVRVGNLVYCDNVIIPAGLTVFELLFSGKKVLEPIPLTEEWMLKFGFERVSEKWFCFKDRFYLLAHSHTIYHPVESKYELKFLDLYLKSDGVQHAMIGSIKYVHQLQNLYFALTGEELTIKD